MAARIEWRRRADATKVIAQPGESSLDSRGLSSMGYDPLDTIVGRAFMRFFSAKAAGAEACNSDKDRSVGWDRLFTMVH